MLNHAFSAGESDAAAASLIIGQISHDGFYQFVGGYGLAYAGKGFGKTRIYTAQTVGAKISVYSMAAFFIRFMCAGGAYRKTPAAADASFGIVFQYRVGGYGFGVVTPTAVKVAALKKYRCADPRPVISRKSLNVENDALVQYYTVLPFYNTAVVIQ